MKWVKQMEGIEHVLIKQPTGGRYRVITARHIYELNQMAPTYSTDLVLGSDRYPEYLLIQHLPPKNIFEYFTEDL